MDGDRFNIALAILSPCGVKTYEKDDAVNVEIKLKCPSSPELYAFLASIPNPAERSKEYFIWKKNFMNSMKKLIELVDSDQIHNSYLTVRTLNCARGLIS